MEDMIAPGGSLTLADGLTLSRMGFGAMRITANPDRSVAIQVLRRAVELGVNHIDTAAFYASPGGTLGVGEGPVRYANELIRDGLREVRRTSLDHALGEVGTYDFTDNMGDLEYYGTITYADGVKPNDMDGD